MTSVLVRGMDMQKECRVCPLKEYNEHTGEMRCKPANVIISRNYKPIWFGGRPDDWCPLVEVKTPHGRLIDATALIKALVRKEPFSDCARVVIAECMEEVRHAPTVIEAEGEE